MPPQAATAVPPPALSVVIPAYQEQDRLGPTLDKITAYLKRRRISYEILVVDDGSTDDTAAVAAGHAGGHVQVLRQPQTGKGAAVRRGVTASRGDWVLISDADLSTPIEELERLEAARDRAEVILGSRALAESRIEVRQPIYRELMGKTFNLIIRSLGLADVRDTQCGFKLIRGDVARALFARMTIDRFAFDIELVWLARALGQRTAEIGVVWLNSPHSTVRPIVDSAAMLRDALRIRMRSRPRPANPGDEGARP